MNTQEQSISSNGPGSRPPISVPRLERAGGAARFILASVILGTVGVFLHQASVDPITATWFRCAFGFVGLTVWAIYRRQLHNLRLARKACFPILTAGSLMVIAWGLFFAAIERTSAGVATVLFHVQPMWVLVLGAWYLKEPVARHRAVAVVIAMMGLVFATGVLEHLSIFGAESDYPPSYWWGVAFCLLGAFFTACVTIIARRFRHVPAVALAWWQCGIGTIALLVWPIVNGWPQWGEKWAWLSGLGLVHTGLAYTLMYAAMARMNADRIATFQFIYPAVAIVVDWLLYGQRLGTLQIFGMAIMAGGIWLAERPARRRC
ncbi:TPA: DMT family transporter [Pseudomonas aeruginosa]|nr:DMT family transporter [Pseudomonas aeruginosa]HEK0165571.1 DMT family transporter [Pseudomonas aeruginosa]